MWIRWWQKNTDQWGLDSSPYYPGPEGTKRLPEYRYSLCVDWYYNTLFTTGSALYASCWYDPQLPLSQKYRIITEIDDYNYTVDYGDNVGLHKNYHYFILILMYLVQNYLLKLNIDWY